MRLYAIWNNDPRIFLWTSLMAVVVPITNMVSYICYHILILTSAGQYIYTSDDIFALPFPLVGCGVFTGNNVTVAVIETYMFLSCITVAY